ncbi:hypothetical protein ACR03S_03845 [Limimaricola variabilis]
MRATIRAAHTVDGFQDWLRAEGHSLVAAAELLGGKKWRASARSVVASVSQNIALIELYDDISELYRLLSLEFTDDLDSEEAELFFAIHPDDPRADEARLCKEALERGLHAMRRLGKASDRATEAA